MLRLACAMTCGFVVVAAVAAAGTSPARSSGARLTSVPEIAGTNAAARLKIAAAGSGTNACIRTRVDLGGLGTHSSLAAVDASSPDNVWAVGARGADPGRPVAEHYDGQTWRQVPVRSLSRGGLLDVEVISPHDVWASASTEEFGRGAPVMLHWNGNQWRRVALPKRVYGVGKLTSDSSADVWVEAAANAPDGSPLTLTLRWTGRRWQSFPAEDGVSDIAFSSPRQGWIVGSKHGDVDVSYAARWTGRIWKGVRVPSAVVGQTTSGQHEGEQLWSVSAGGVGNVWAVGFSVSSGFTGWYTLHWDGHRWRLGRDSGGTAFRRAWLSATGAEISIAAAKQGDVWLVAGQDAAARNNRGTWSALPHPARDVDLHAVAAVRPGQAWAVGDRGFETSLSNQTAEIERLDCPA